MSQNVVALAGLKESRARDYLGVAQRAMQGLRKAHRLYPDAIDRLEMRQSAVDCSLQVVQANMGVMKISTGLLQHIKRLDDESDPDGIQRAELRAAKETIGQYVDQMTALMEEGNELMKLFTGELVNDLEEA